MAWTSMHFAVGMGGAAVIGGLACAVTRRGWRWLPLAMTAGGVWAIVPDLPRLWREDFPSLPFAATLGDHGLERRLHAVGDLFFFHARLDAQPREFALHGLVLVLALYNLAILLLLWLEHRQRRRASRAADLHAPHIRAVREQPAGRPQLHGAGDVEGGAGGASLRSPA